MSNEKDIHIRARASIMKSAFGLVPAPELERHLEECEECQKLVPILRIKADGLRETNLVVGIVQRGLRGDPRILSREDGSLIYFFQKAKEGEEQGHLVVLDRETRDRLDHKLATEHEFWSFKYVAEM